MKTRVIPFLMILLLCGCHAGDRGITRVSSLSPPSEATQSYAQGLYDPCSDMEKQTAGAVQAFVLPKTDAYGLRMLGDGLLVFSGTEETTLTLLRGDSLQIEQELQLDFFLDPRAPSVQVGGNTFSYYDPVNEETVVANTALTVISRFPKPRGLSGTPVFSSQQNTIFYCTEGAIYAWNLESGRHRLLRNTSQPRQITALLSSGSILQFCSADNPELESLFISTDTGKLLYTHSGSLLLTSNGSHYYGIVPGGPVSSLVFGTVGAQTMILKSAEPEGSCIFLERSHGALTVSCPGSETVQLDYYDLNTGFRTATLALSETQLPLSVAGDGFGNVYLLSHDSQYDSFVLYRWNTRCGNLRDTKNYTGVYYTRSKPDEAGLDLCRAYAAALSEKYGIRILLWKDAVREEPWDYKLEPEHSVDILAEELRKLDENLSCYPPEILRQTAAHFTALNICLVRSITGTDESGQPDRATGIQFLQGTDAYVVIAAGEYADRSLYHELYHVMETHIYGNSIALDQWEKLNPAGFSYDYSYLSNRTRESGVYLRHDTRSFVDTYSMSYPKEDRARILEYAMMPGNRELFQAQTLQRKLRALCDGIREAYGLEKSTEVFLWEQYLE